MTQAALHTTPAELDRLRELVSIGVGHAATALARLSGRTIRMSVPSVRPIDPGGDGAALEPGPGVSAVLFEVRGGPGGIVVLLLSASSREVLLERVLGNLSGRATEAEVESAIREIGNVLVSSLLSAVADTLGLPIVPTVPDLAVHRAAQRLRARVDARRETLAGMCIAGDLFDEVAEVRGRLLWLPGAGA